MLTGSKKAETCTYQKFKKVQRSLVLYIRSHEGEAGEGVVQGDMVEWYLNQQVRGDVMSPAKAIPTTTTTTTTTTTNPSCIPSLPFPLPTYLPTRLQPTYSFSPSPSPLQSYKY